MRPFAVLVASKALLRAQDTRGTIAGRVQCPRVPEVLQRTSRRWFETMEREFVARVPDPRGLRFQVRMDAINLQNRSQMNPPDISPVSTLFGRITSQTSSLNRFYQIQGRLQF